METASVIKMFVMGAVMNAVEQGKLPYSQTVQHHLHQVIVFSSNESWKTLATMLGGGNYSAGMREVTRWAAASGYPNSGKFPGNGLYNTTTAEDVGHFLADIANGTSVSKTASTRMLALLKAQHYTEKLPAGVPKGVVTANKTGELHDTENNAAIIYAPFGTYIIVVLTKGGSTENIRALSSIVYAEMKRAA